MIELGLWVVSFIVVVWAILNIGLPLLVGATAVVIVGRKVIVGIISLVMLLIAISIWESNQQQAFGIGIIAIALLAWAFSSQNDNVTSDKALARNPPLEKTDIASIDFSNENDDMYEDAVRVVASSGKASTSLLQRRLRIGYARAARLIEEMEERGAIGPADGARPRDVLVK